MDILDDMGVSFFFFKVNYSFKSRWAKKLVLGSGCKYNYLLLSLIITII